KGAVGANEWHRIRAEIAIVTKGSVAWTNSDIENHTSTLILNRRQSILIPPFILHTYKVLEDDAELLILANTLFNPEDPATHDTYSKDQFYKLMNTTIE